MFSKKQLSVVSSSTFAFTICFAIWMMFAVIGIPIKTKLGLNETEFGLLTAMPVLSGSLIRLPLGMLTDKLGGRIVFFILMLCCIVPIWFIGDATEYWQFLVLLSRYRLRRTLVRQEESGAGDGHLWCG
jgi:MFS transporter, NNP family, nitrate/nitrite transporter